MAVNFDTRGNAGESQLFETSGGNGRLVKLFAQTAPHPAGSSLSYEIYKRLPNDTDMTVFKKGRAAGLNSGFIGHWEAYHTPLDSAGSLDRGSLQQQGESALSLARALGNADLGAASGPGRRVFFYSRKSVSCIIRADSSGRSLVGTGVFLLAIFFYANGAWQTRLLPMLASFLVHLERADRASAIGAWFCGRRALASSARASRGRHLSKQLLRPGAFRIARLSAGNACINFCARKSRPGIFSRRRGIVHRPGTCFLQMAAGGQLRFRLAFACGVTRDGHCSVSSRTSFDLFPF